MKPKPDVGNHKFEDSPLFRLSTFYSVAVSDSGEVLEILNDQQELHTDSELEAMAKSIIAAGETEGTEKDLVFHMTEKDGYTLVAFMDNTIINESAATLFRFTLIFGGAFMVVFFFLAMFLARKIVAPLEEGYRKQKQFISDAGHELKTPVSVVNTNAELLSREIGENRWLENIRYENERMGLLVGQLLELAHTESVTPQMEKLDFSRLCQGEALPHESVAFEQGLSLKLYIAENVTVMGNGTQLRQLVSILLDNAIRHSTGGEVTLTLSRDRGHARLSVVNEGEPIPEEQREHLFERFYRVDTARNGEGKHYGLGLAIAKSIVQSHKGKIGVQCRDGLVELLVSVPCLDK
ncbi:MAG: HAMP domain-containing histidine kinase [Clostridia bacterium]|nr:HAMP domain-containing histidine kinase [Clostridia bacterium]